MEHLTWTFDDRPWPDGPWMDEHDKEQWTDEATGLPCLLYRNPRMGHLCGYVGVGPDHPLFGVGEVWDNEVGALEVHGGVTFTGRCAEESTMPAGGICHVAPGDERWWIGFDAAHAGDMSPGLEALGCSAWPDEYRTADYMREQCAHLARQLAALS